jgi:4-amino-4-deoxy-L-arabinose transferase-like glycosyltransferase
VGLARSRGSVTGSESSRVLTPLVLLVIFSIAARIPLILSHVQLEYGDGVYGASAIALRDGALPFREVFSSQGPIFLPLVRAFDAIGFQTLWAPRLAAAAAGIVLVVATFALTRRAATIAGATAAAALVAFSPIVLDVSSELQSDAIAVAFATIAVWLAAGIRTDEPEWWRIVMVGLACGGALGVKGPLVGPPIAAARCRPSAPRGLPSACRC